jgi:hypothetical protein
MARRLHLIGVWLLALSLGVLGYQLLHYLFNGTWPPVSVQYVWMLVLGDFPMPNWALLQLPIRWVISVSLVGLGLILAYAAFITSDILRRKQFR